MLRLLVFIMGTLVLGSGYQDEHEHDLLRWDSNESLKNMISSYERKTFGFPTLTPLNSSRMDSGFRGSGSFARTDPRPWIRLFSKLRSQQQINLHVFGGSNTDGNGCKGKKKVHYYDMKKKCAWQYRFRLWLQNAFAGVKIVHKSWAVASSDSMYALGRFRDTLESNETIHLALFDPSMNDRWAYEDEKKNNATLLASTEGIILLAKRYNVAVIYLSVYMGAISVCDDVYHLVCAHHGVPMLSYRSLVIDEVRYAFSLAKYEPTVHVNHTRSPVFYNTKKIEDLHPVFQSHVVIAQFVCDFFEKAYRFYSYDRYKTERDDALATWTINRNPGSAFGGEDYSNQDGDGQSLVDDRISCRPIQTFFSSLPNDQHLVTNKKFHLSSEAVGWKFMADIPNKPQGWISEGTTYGKLLLPVLVVNGKVTVSYLKSYKNCGKFQLFFQPSKFLAGNFAPSNPSKIRDNPTLIPCCRNPWQTYAVVIDTFDNSSRTSVIVSRTYKFDVIGLLNVVLQRVSLSKDEITERSGDKVKIISIRTC